MTREQFLRAYANLPEDERDEPFIIIDGKTYTWNAAFYEVKAETPLGEKIIKRMKELGLTDE
ncbi:MAG: hypothetical protein ACE5FT_00045 [Candidatus Nanoarchaeia archaeon]